MDGISCIWHAFDALDEKKTGRVCTTTLRVLTHNIGTSLGLHDVEKALPENNTDISFEDYIKCFRDNVPSVYLSATGLKTIADITWLICEKSMTRRSCVSVLGPTDVHKLWLVFHVICMTDSEGQSIQPVVIDIEEAAFITRQIRDRAIGTIVPFDSSTTASGSPVPPLAPDEPTTLDFFEFLRMIENVCTSETEHEVASATIDELHQYYSLQKLKKGELAKSGDHIRSWKKRWFVLTTTTLNYYSDQAETDCKGTIALQDIVKVETPAAEKKGTVKTVSLLINCGSRTYELHCPDLKTRHSWHQALLDAVDNVMSEVSLPKKVFLARQKARNERRARELEELLQKQHEKDAAEQKLLGLVADKERSEQERRELEARLKREEELRLLDEQRLQELEELQRQQERLLEEERQAKRDEEIVRALQARMLEEEMQKREYLEELRAQQEAVLQQERSMREQLQIDRLRLAAAIEEERRQRQDVELQKQLKEEEGRAAQEQLERERLAREQLAESSRQRHEELERLRQQQEELLATERSKLEKLEEGRRQADEQLQVAIQKLHDAEKAKQIVEQRAKLHNMETVGLRRPLQPRAQPLVTHRGYGAFPDNFAEIQKALRNKEKGLTDTSCNANECASETTGCTACPDGDSAAQSTLDETRLKQSPSSGTNAVSAEGEKSHAESDLYYTKKLETTDG